MMLNSVSSVLVLDVILSALPMAAQTRAAAEYHTIVNSDTGIEQRKDAFYRLVASYPGPKNNQVWDHVPGLMALQPDHGDQLSLDLITALTKDRVVIKGPKELDAEYSDYYADLLAMLDTARDPRSLDILFKCIDSGRIAMEAVASFGDPAYEKAIQLRDQPGGMNRQNAVWLLSEMAMAKNIHNFSDPAQAKTKILNALVNAAGDSNINIRYWAVEGLQNLEDPRAVPTLRKIAESDPDYGPQAGEHSLRKKAATAIGKLQVK